MGGGGAGAEGMVATFTEDRHPGPSLNVYRLSVLSNLLRST